MYRSIWFSSIFCLSIVGFGCSTEDRDAKNQPEKKIGKNVDPLPKDDDADAAALAAKRNKALAEAADLMSTMKNADEAKQQTLQFKLRVAKLRGEALKLQGQFASLPSNLREKLPAEDQKNGQAACQRFRSESARYDNLAKQAAD